MADYVDELCENYSQGMKQRVVFASALVHDPKVLVVDEPLVGLDPRSARIVKDLFVAQARSGVAVLMSTHLLSIAEELADTIGIIDHGRMLARGRWPSSATRVQLARAARRPVPEADRRRPAAEPTATSAVDPAKASRCPLPQETPLMSAATARHDRSGPARPPLTAPSRPPRAFRTSAGG